MTVEGYERRRSFLIGKAKPNAIVGRNRETGELAVLAVGCLLAMVCGFAVPTLPLKILTIIGCPVAAGAIVFAPYRKRTYYRWFEIDRAYRRLVRSRNAFYASNAETAGTTLRGVELPVPAPPGVGQVRWITARFGPDELAVLMHLDRGTVTCTIEIEGPGVGSATPRTRRRWSTVTARCCGTWPTATASSPGCRCWRARCRPTRTRTPRTSPAAATRTRPAGSATRTRNCSRWSPPPASSTAPI